MKQNSEKFHPMIDKRTFKVKNPSLCFYCPLCRMERQTRYRPHLSKLNYWQIGAISGVLMLLTFERMQGHAFIWPFVTWSIFEGVRRALFKREIPCPHCGFDASWYKRDVREAKRLVSQFWQNKLPDQVPLPEDKLRLAAEKISRPQ